MYEQVHQDQTQITYKSENNTYFNAYNLGCEAQSNFLWKPQPVVTPIIQRSTFVDVPYYNIPYSQYQPSPTIYSPSFEEKVLQALDKIEINNQFFHSTQFLIELEV